MTLLALMEKNYTVRSMLNEGDLLVLLWYCNACERAGVCAADCVGHDK